MPIASVNPATGEKLKEFPAFSDSEIEERLKLAERAFAHHRRRPFAKRAELMMATASLLEQEKDELARTITLEMGKLFRAAQDEIVKCARGCRFYAENAERFLEDEAAQTDAARSYVCYQPLGPVLAIMPWNFPFWQVFRFAAPALMAGNVGLLKHAANVPQCALAIENVLCRAGFEEGVFQTLLIEDNIYEQFLERFRERMRALKVGDPMDDTTELGPLATEQILQGVHEQVQKSIAAGAKLLTGGNRIHGAGFFYAPTVLVDVPKESPAYREEVFGPVASIFRVRDAADAIEIANDTRFGLAASAWTNDPAEQELFTSELETGMVFINAMVASDPRLPFGGVKRSGFGRELGAAGIREFTNTKTIWIS